MHVCKGKSPEHCPEISVGTCLYCARRRVGGVMRSYFHSGLGESFTWIVSPAIPPLPRRSKLYLGPGTSLVLAAVRGLGSVLTVVLCFFLTCL